MIALAELHNLIGMLNKAEKRFFKLSSATESVKTDKAVRLFNLIESTGDDDDIYYRTDQDETADLSAANLDLLFHLILKSQRSYYAESITGFSISNEISSLRILFEKAHYRQCRKMIKPLKTRALGHEKFNYLLEIVELEKDLLQAEGAEENYLNAYQELLAQQHGFMEREKEVGLCYQLYSTLKFRMKSQGPDGRKAPDFYIQFLKKPEIRNIPEKYCGKAKFLIMLCRALCYTALRRQQDRCRQLLELKDLCSRNEFLADEMPAQFIDILYNLANAWLELNEPEKVQQLVKEMSNLANARKIPGADLIVRLQSYSYNVQLLLLIHTGQFREASELCSEITGIMNNRLKLINREDKSVLLFNMTTLYIYCGNYLQAERSIEKILTESDRKARRDIKCFARLLQLIIYLELGQSAAIPLAVNILKSLEESLAFGGSEQATIRFFETLPAKGGPPGKKEFAAWHRELARLMKKREEQWTNFFYFNFYAYSASKAGKGELRDIIINTYQHAAF